jgi:uncharacterized protein
VQAIVSQSSEEDLKMNVKRVFICLLILFLIGCQNSRISENSDSGGKSDNMNEQWFQAAQQGNKKEIMNLLEQDVDINSRDEQGRTAVMIATYSNDLETARVLIEKGADVNIRDNMENNPFLYAGAEGFLEIVKLTIEAGADPKRLNRYGGTALIPASEHGYVEVVKELLERTDIDVNHINNLGWTALMEAIVLNNGGQKQQETIALLIAHGADVNIPDSEGVTPLQHAKEKGFVEIEKILIAAGAK